MKSLLFTLILLLSFQLIFAQQYEDVIKFLPVNLRYNQASFEWEHQEKRNSLIVGVGIPYHQSIINRSFGEFVATPTDFKSADLYSYSIRVGYRHYISNNEPFGAYLEGYIKSQTIDFNTSLTSSALSVAFSKDANISFILISSIASFSVQKSFVRDE